MTKVSANKRFQFSRLNRLKPIFTWPCETSMRVFSKPRGAIPVTIDPTRRKSEIADQSPSLGLAHDRAYCLQALTAQVTGTVISMR